MSEQVPAREQVPAGEPTDEVLDDLAARIRTLPPKAGTSVVVAVDGPAGAGKTTLAGRLAERLGAPVVHMDDIYPGWDGLAEAAGAIARVLGDLAAGRPAGHRRWDWANDRYDTWQDVPAAPVLVVEGCGSASRAGAVHLSLIVWVDAPHDLRMARGIERDGEGFRPHWERWARQEDELFAAERTRERADVHVQTG